MNGIIVFVAIGILILFLSTYNSYVQTASKIKYNFATHLIKGQQYTTNNTSFILFLMSNLLIQYNQLDTNKHGSHSNALLKTILFTNKPNNETIKEIIFNYINDYLKIELIPLGVIKNN